MDNNQSKNLYKKDHSNSNIYISQEFGIRRATQKEAHKQ